jgi:hypothetical protein
MFIGCRVGVLVGMDVGKTVAVGSAVLVGESVLVGFWVGEGKLGNVAGEVLKASFTVTLLTGLHPLAMKINNNPKAEPVIAYIEVFCLPINRFMMNIFPYGFYYSQFVSPKFKRLVRLVSLGLFYAWMSA